MGINDIIQIGNRIRKLRTERGLTQKEMAEMTGIPYSTYSNYENNNREPSLEQLNKIANALNLTLQNLISPGSITAEVILDSDEMATLYLGIIGNLKKLNATGFRETEHYTRYLLSDNRYTNSDEPPQD